LSSKQPCFTILYGKSKNYGKEKIHQTITEDDVVQQIICTIKIRRAPTGHISYFQPLITKTSEISTLSVIIGYKEYDSKDNLILVRDVMYVFSVIPTRRMRVPIRRTC